ncbi:MAG: dihydrofolate reductase [Aerococcus sp.]|nr:dihydrofolate reductase [Aerococcus sp.]
MLIAIFAHDQNHLIGNQKHLPWHLPNDMAFFKKQTTGHPLIMGRTTFDGMGKKPLPNRQNIVITHNPDQYTEEMSKYDNLEIVESTEGLAQRFSDTTAYISGGRHIFEELWDVTDELRITQIEATFTGDTYFDPDLSDFERYRTIDGVVDAKNKYPHHFEYWRRKA